MDIGRYRLITRIGTGGGGVVYLAEQEQPVRCKVALKVIKLGMDTEAVLARFELERQSLAQMDHPNIAHVYDAGTTESGRPYFVMELVEGEKITGFCDAHRLDIRQRLVLFVLVCRAIQHAHQKGVINPDIKPSNVLVRMHEGIPAPKVIDFGIAKAITTGSEAKDSTFTPYNQFIGTPAYMSPEQAQGSNDVDTRSDIYSLGGATSIATQTGGTLNTTGYFVMGGGQTTTGTYNLSAGTVNAATGFGFTTIGSQLGNTETLSVSGTGIFNSSQGGIGVGEGYTGTGTTTATLNVYGGGLVNLGTSTLQLGINAGANGTVNLNGGTIQTAVITKGNGGGTFNFNGGVLKATATSTTFMTGLTAANVLEGGAKINDGGFSVTVGQALQHGGAAAIDGGLTKSGAGTLFLGSANTFTGPTTVTAGVLTLMTLAELSDTATLSLSSGTALNLNAASGTEIVNILVLNSTTEPGGHLYIYPIECLQFWRHLFECDW